MRKFRLKLATLLFKWAFKISPGQQLKNSICGYKVTNKVGDQQHEYVMVDNDFVCKLCNFKLLHFGKFRRWDAFKGM